MCNSVYSGTASEMLPLLWSGSVTYQAVSLVGRSGLGRKSCQINDHPSEDNYFLYKLACQQPGNSEILVLCLKPSMKI